MSRSSTRADIGSIRKEIEQGNIQPIYVIYGTQQLIKEEFVRLLHDQVLADDADDFNYEVFDMQEHPVQTAVEAAETFPFMGDRRLVVAREASFLTSARENKDVEHDLDMLLRYAEDPVDHAVLALVVDEEKLDERKKLVKTLKKQAVMVPCLDLKEDRLVGWLQDLAGQYRTTIAESACHMLLQLAGTDMQMLKSEMEKMARYVGEDGTITGEVVQELVSRTIEQDVFKLVDHVVHMRTAQALDTLHELLKQNEEPIKILFLLARQFRIIYRVKEMSQRGYGQRDMASAIGVHPFVIKLALNQARQYHEQQLRMLLKQLAELDHQMKSGKIEKVLALELFLLRLGARKKQKKNTYA